MPRNLKFQWLLWNITVLSICPLRFCLEPELAWLWIPIYFLTRYNELFPAVLSKFLI